MKDINNYTFVSRVDSGSCGSVFHMKKEGIDYAVKRSYIDDTDGIENLTELDIVSRCRHTHIISMIDVFATSKNIYFSMTLGDLSLETYLQSQLEHEPPKERYRLACELVSAVEFLHSVGIYHGDIKPANILLKDNKILLCDFDSGCVEGTNYICKPTEYYAPPELLVSSTIYLYNYPPFMKEYTDKKYPVTNITTDSWSLGVVMAEILSGQFLFRGAHKVVGYVKDPTLHLNNTKLCQADITLVSGLLDPNPNTRVTDYSIITKNPALVSVPFDQPTIHGLVADQQYNCDRMTERVAEVVAEWMYEVCQCSDVSARCYFLSVELFYRCFDLVYSGLNGVQLIAMACMFISSKICRSESRIKSDRLIYLCDNSFTTVQLLEMESKIVVQLKGRLISKTVYDMCNSLEALRGAVPLVRQKSWYLADKETAIKQLETTQSTSKDVKCSFLCK
jgi:serine/threonine protein kinase